MQIKCELLLDAVRTFALMVSISPSHIYDQTAFSESSFSHVWKKDPYYARVRGGG